VKGVRFYEEFHDPRKRRSTGNCLAIFPDNYAHGEYEAYVAAMAEPNSMPASGGVSIEVLRRKCKRVPESRARAVHPNLFTWLDDDRARMKAHAKNARIVAVEPEEVCTWLLAHTLTVGQKVRVWTGRGWLDYHEGTVAAAELYPTPEDAAFSRSYVWSRKDIYTVRYDREPAYPGEPREGQLRVLGARGVPQVSFGKAGEPVYKLGILDPPPAYTLDGESIDLQEFLDANPRDDNPEVDPDEIRALAPGGVIFYGGGAQPRCILRRVR